MQKAFLVTNKTTQVRDYLEHRSIIQITEEHKSLSELDLGHLGIIDVDKFIYLYYASDDGDLAFRSDLNILRNLLSSAFFHVDEGIFILIDCKNPMLEDLIRSATRGTSMIGSALQIIHHEGALTFSDVSKYIAGTVIGSETTSSYKAVYVKEADTDEKERYASVTNDGIASIIPTLTDQYTMYKKRAEVEGISSGHTVTDSYTRPQTMKNFPRRTLPAIQQWHMFLQTGDPYTRYELGINYLAEYLTKTGIRTLIIDMTDGPKVIEQLSEFKYNKFIVSDISTQKLFAERLGYLACHYSQLGYVIQMLDNIQGVMSYIVVCNPVDFKEIQILLSPLCRILCSSYTTHFTEECVQKYLSLGIKVTSLFLSSAVMEDEFNLQQYKSDFKGTRVARLELYNADTTDYYECLTGGGM